MRRMALWAGAIIVAFALHVIAAALLMTHEREPKPQPKPEPVIALELAPKPKSTPQPVPIAKPEAKPEHKPPPKPKPTPKPEHKTHPKPKPKPKPKPAPKRKPKTQSTAKPEPAPETEQKAVPKPESAAPEATQAPPPATHAASRPSKQEIHTWQAKLLAHLAKYKHYPRGAQRRNKQGVVMLSFSIDRTGRVLSARVVESSGHTSLDQAALDMIHDASPVPAPPNGITQLDFTVPVQFTLR
jgi:protein TonB